MRAVGSRTKKLIVAFHFTSRDQAGWKCDACRRSGLEERRRCGWRQRSEEGEARVVWARRNVAIHSCPKSFITAQSLAFLEEYYAWKLAGQTDLRTLSARQVVAFCVLENEARAERGESHE